MGRKKLPPLRKFNLPGKLRYGTDRRWVICDPTNPDALIYMVWPELAESIVDLDRRMPEIWRLNERRMERWVKPTKLLDQLRCIFWSNVYDCRALNIKVKAIDVLTGFMNKDKWESIIHVDANLAYFIRPIPKVSAAYESLMWRCFKKLVDVVDIDFDFINAAVLDRANYMRTLFMVMRECNARMNHKSRWRSPLEQDAYIDRLKADLRGVDFNLNDERPGSGPPSVDQFDLEDLSEDIFGDVEEGDDGDEEEADEG